MRYALALACMVASCNEALAEEALSGAEVQQLFKTKKLRTCFQVMIDGQRWTILYAGKSSILIDGPLGQKDVSIDDLDELSKMQPLGKMPGCFAG